MQHLIEKNGFQRCGIIYVEDGSPRIAYEKIKEGENRKVKAKELLPFAYKVV